MESRTGWVIGLDAGGTSTRCVLADPTGRRLGTGRAAGLNQHSSGGDAVAVLEQALRACLGDRPPGAVRGGVLAVAGAGSAGLAKVRAEAESAWRGLGLGGVPVVVPDVVATFAGGAAEAAGVVLVAGTGAIAAAVQGMEVVRRADGYGWLLGDVGSAVWLGREAVAAGLAALDGRSRPSALTRPILDALDGAEDGQDVVRAVYSRPPAQLGRLAPVLTEVAAAGDPVALDIVHRGVTGLLASFDAVSEDRGGPTVLGGALLTTPGPVLDGVRAGLGARGVSDVRTSTDAAAGAVTLALRLMRDG